MDEQEIKFDHDKYRFGYSYIIALDIFTSLSITNHLLPV